MLVTGTTVVEFSPFVKTANCNSTQLNNVGNRVTCESTEATISQIDCNRREEQKRGRLMKMFLRFRMYGDHTPIKQCLRRLLNAYRDDEVYKRANSQNS